MKKPNRLLRMQAGPPLPLKRMPTLAEGSRYKCRRVSGALWRLLEYRDVNNDSQKSKYPHARPKMRWVCIAIGTKALKTIAFRLNLLP